MRKLEKKDIKKVIRKQKKNTKNKSNKENDTYIKCSRDVMDFINKLYYIRNILFNYMERTTRS